MLLRSALLVLIGFCGLAHAADPKVSPSDPPLRPCDVPVRFSAEYFADPEVDTSRSTAEITKLGNALEASERSVQLGHVMVQTEISVVPQATCSGFQVILKFVKPVLRIASNLPPGSCAEALVRRHEWTHVKIYREIAHEFRHLQYHGFGPLRSANVMRFAKQEWKRLEYRQVLFDSPEEYAKSQTMCGGEIPKLLHAAAPAVSKD
ncbi:hypothetical protein OOZ63_17760 [Paucibacter sp. PLA-PC-4]|uniref:hypothetical protein n=1 Tax=Paucibacter sp. PLA-PC-4 TaxID=2993655 RepID=UPI00224B498A|nr:hypothetical protein [Paucibacter sp. PLA-PC-4]MCX2863679.1 hypothetical protein [Paucibacter sp. PLA-PC-4]